MAEVAINHYRKQLEAA